MMNQGIKIKMQMRRARIIIATLLFASFMFSNRSEARDSSLPPNVVIVFLDDSGFGDFHPFGSPAYQTPNVARLAREGRVFRNFYVPQAICSASRAALLSGCYPGRTKMFGAHRPKARGLSPSFTILSEVLRKKGYKTGFFGKWHIGDQPDTRPPARGFDESCGLMYSNDMWEFHPENPKYWGKFPLQFWENGEVSIPRVTKKHQPMLTTWYTEHAVRFIEKHRDEPFFLYVPHSMPHVPIFCSDKFLGKSGQGLYGDVMMEIDWSVGEIVKALESNGVTNDTLVMFTSDNGPWVSYGHHAGTTPYREAKGTSFDGGVRSACIMKFPKRLAAGSVSEATFCSIDILPTVAHLAGASLPENRIDGHDVWDLISGKKGAKNPSEYYPLSTGRNFDGLITGDGHWKLHLRHRYRSLVTPGANGAAGKYKTMTIEPSLYDMRNDPFETKNLIGTETEVAARLMKLAEKHRAEFFSTPGKKRKK